MLQKEKFAKNTIFLNSLNGCLHGILVIQAVYELNICNTYICIYYHN